MSDDSGTGFAGVLILGFWIWIVASCEPATMADLEAWSKAAAEHNKRHEDKP